jgi:hypothetical protein
MLDQVRMADRITARIGLPLASPWRRVSTAAPVIALAVVVARRFGVR